MGVGVHSPVLDIEDVIHFKQMELDSLLEITKAINNNASAENLYKIYGFTLRAQMNVSEIAIFYNGEDYWNLVYHTGVEANELNEFFHEEEWKNYKKITALDQTAHSVPSVFKNLIPVYHKDRPLAYVLCGEPKLRSFETREEKLKFVKTITNIIIVAIENKRLFKQHIEQEKIKKELELAEKVQTMLIPKELPDNDYIQMSSIYMPHHNIGGDYYDVIPISEEEFIFCIADVSGKGVAAALLMANFQALLHAHAQQGIFLDELIEKLNRRVVKITNGDNYLTMFLGSYNIHTRNLNYINAGHPPPLLAYGDKIELLEKGCTILGCFDSLPFINQGNVEIPEQSTILMFTDGLSELEDETGRYFDEKMIYDFVSEHHQLPVQELNATLLESIHTFKGKQLFSDDITVVSCKVF